jgi:hypothetical protein
LKFVPAESWLAGILKLARWVWETSIGWEFESYGLADAVYFERVSAAEFPANREINRENPALRSARNRFWRKNRSVKFSVWARQAQCQIAEVAGCAINNMVSGSVAEKNAP